MYKFNPGLDIECALSLTAYCSLFAAMLLLFSLQSKASSSSSFSLSQMSSSVQFDTNALKLSRQRSRHDEFSCVNRKHSQTLISSFSPIETHTHTHTCTLPRQNAPSRNPVNLYILDSRD